MQDASPVPVLALHSIAPPHDHVLRGLSLPVTLFERMLAYLRGTGFQAVDLHDVQRHLAEGRPLPRRAFAITFDDGYLDNWVYALPLLERYGMKATLFVGTSFIDPDEQVRPTLADVWAGRIAAHELEWWGHLRWAELQRMQASGVIDVQSHTVSHDRQFVGPRIVDFLHPRADHHWLYWQARPARRPHWLGDDFQAAHVPGTPVHEHAPALLGPRYTPPPALAAACVEHVACHGGAAYFARAEWRADLLAVAARAAREAGEGSYESDDAWRTRVTAELADSRALLEQRLDKPVDLLCWPFGDYHPELQRLAIERCGYTATVNVAKRANRRGDDPRELSRVVFEQDYAGPAREALVFAHFVGMMHFRCGERHAWPVAPLTRRVMRVGRAWQRLRGRA